MTSDSWVKRSTPVQSASVTTPTGRPSVDDHDRAVRPLGQQGQRVGDGLVGGQRDRGVVDEVAAA